MKVNFKMWQFFAIVYALLTVGNLAVGALLGTAAWITLTTQIAYTFCIITVWAGLMLWLPRKLNDAWHESLARTLEEHYGVQQPPR